MKALVKSWLHDQPEEERHIEGWIEDYFYKALDWVVKRNEFVVETTLVGVVMNGLSHLKNIKTKPEFVCALLRGLGSNLNATAKSDLAKEVKISVSYNGFTFQNCLDIPLYTPQNKWKLLAFIPNPTLFIPALMRSLS